MIKDILARAVRRVAKVSAHPYEGLPLVVVSGVGRSGTTALRHSLSAHPAVHSTDNENNILFDVLETARHNCTYPSRRATMHVAPAAYDRQFRLLLLNLLWPEPRRGSRRPRMLLATSDMTADRAEYLIRVFPGVRVAYIVRSGIEVLSSRLVHPNFCDVPFEDHCRIWCQSREMAAWGEHRPGFALVRHETLLEPESARRAVAAMLDTLGLPYWRGCVDIVVGEHYHPTAFGRESAPDSADLRRRQERWRLWDDQQRVTFERLCGDAMRALGYAIPWH